MSRADAHCASRPLHALRLVIAAACLACVAAAAWAQDTPQARTFDPGADAAPRRFALVIGQSDYRDAKLITGTADASRVAEALESAGFTIESGADLEQHLIREKIRILVERTSQQEVETILVYLGGRVAQINGENVLLPVGAPIEHASDVILNGFRLNDLINALKLVPAKAHIILVDAAAPPKRLTADENFSPGLAIVHAPEGFLIGFSQNPGRPLVEPQPPMGHYIRGFLDALQKPVGSYADVFALARQRVFEESKNRQMPWEDNKLSNPDLTFFPPPPGDTLPSVARASQPDVKLASLSREDAFKRVIASDKIIDYQAFLIQFPKDEAVPTIQYNLAVRREAEVWARALRLNTPAGYWTYIQTYPDGGNVEVARRKLASLGATTAPQEGFRALVFDDLPPPLPKAEFIASSASMPVEFLPAAPSLRLQPIAPMIAAAAAMPLATAIGRQLTRPAAVFKRPSWSSPARPPGAYRTPVGVAPPLSAARSRNNVAAPLPRTPVFRPITPQRSVASDRGQPRTGAYNARVERPPNTRDASPSRPRFNRIESRPDQRPWKGSVGERGAPTQRGAARSRPDPIGGNRSRIVRPSIRTEAPQFGGRSRLAPGSQPAIRSGPMRAAPQRSFPQRNLQQRNFQQRNLQQRNFQRPRVQAPRVQRARPQSRGCGRRGRC